MKVNKKGFTMIEMAVAMAVLSMIVIAMSRIYQQSLVATETGYRLSHGNLVGRTVMQYIVDDLQNCVLWRGGNSFDKINISTDSGVDFSETITYSLTGNGLERKVVNDDERIVYANPTADFGNMSVELVDFDMEATPADSDFPEYIDISFKLEIRNLKGTTEFDDKRYHSRVYLGDGNINRYNNLGEYATFAPIP